MRSAPGCWCRRCAAPGALGFKAKAAKALKAFESGEELVQRLLEG